MNKYTNLKDFTQDAEEIRDELCSCIDRERLIIIDNILYELIEESENVKHKYRFYFNSEDYDYLEDEEFIAKLDCIFNKCRH